MALSSSNVDAVSLASKWNPSREKTFKNIIESLPGNYKSQLEASRERIPKVLFRAFNAKSGGGHPTLNTEKGIVPHTYVHETAARPLHFAFQKFKATGEGYVAVINTKHLSEGNQRIYHVPALIEAFEGRKSNVGVFSWEYLAHGIIAGPGYNCFRIKDILDLGFFDLYEDVYKSMFPRDPSFANLSRKKMFRQKRNSSENGIPAVQVEHAYAVRAKQMAMAWIKDAHDNIKEELLATITVAFLALRPLFWNNPLDPRIIRDQTTIIEALREGPDSYQIPASLKDDTAMMKALVYVNGYPEIEQAMQMLWALALQSS